ncbi:MAG: 50S ribosomal protein L24 [Candidatus Yanofskybacteria bacterium RIFCSPHIGHO2_02_FULL_50_12]|uniref:Large ribosomal subunit protein uL24 n=1 Tax=Candidatus Yanofskybacteria bacterium RIFCSPHIGHO2_02_FULL_50_12 TaxID=1802685 RepID=A0A1F8FZ00_9BACT|nr:MAG: 50S ribosomal protein L24 [Candidatus Yanofskybacteria bacterium RIFCSPHIGHO2_02_FULL_50_12]
MKIHKGDNVMMLTGKDRGKTGKILVTIPQDEKVVVEGLNLMKRHTRARKQGQKGQIISKERPVHAASVALVCPSCGKTTRIGFKVESDAKTRICKKCKNEVK